MKTPIQMLADMRRAQTRHALLSRTNNGEIVDVMAQFNEEFGLKRSDEDASSQLDRMLTRQEFVGGAK